MSQFQGEKEERDDLEFLRTRNEYEVQIRAMTCHQDC